MSAAPGILNLTFPQGATWDLSLTWTDGDGDPIDLTAHSARMQVRSEYTAGSPVLSLVNGTGITLGGTAGTIEVNVAATATAAIPAAQYVYDLEVEAASFVTRVVQGTLTVSPEVTR